MSYAQLLDPKGAAKEKAKKKAAPSYGPQQARKSTTTQPQTLSSSPLRFDPKALLNPKAGTVKSKPATPPHMGSPNGDALAANASEVDGSGQGMGAMLERQFGITTRDAAPPVKKRKVEAVDGDEDGTEDDEGKKSKGTFSRSGGGELGKHLREEREKGANKSGGPSANPIDLTLDDDDEEEIMFLGESNNDNKEVCLGLLHSQAMIHQIPQMPKHQLGKMGKDFWPQTRVNFRRTAARNSIIELISKSPNGTNLGYRFGSMDGKLATVLCPLLDGNNVNKMRLKVFTDAFPKKTGESPGFRTSRSIPIRVIIYAPRRRADMIGRFLSQKQFFLQAPFAVDPGVEIYNPHNLTPTYGRPGTGTRKPQGSSSTTYVTRTQEEMLRETTSMFDDLVKSEDLPEMEADSNLIVTELMSHQKQALHFLTQHELANRGETETGSNFSLWKSKPGKNGEAWYNVITGHEVSEKPEPSRGGILADVMGLGKTLSILALVANTTEEAELFGSKDAPKDSVELKRNSKATLIICPKSVMSNWEEQIKIHTTPKKFKVYSYHGTNRTQDVEELAKYDIVLSPYQTAAAEFSDSLNKRKALASINWFRVVLDEAHQIRNPTTHVSKACCKLAAERRWAVTGTPVQNRLDDLGALIKFLRIKPFDESTNWTQHITSPFKNANENVLTNLRLLVDSITLRRLKDKIGLVERNTDIVRLTFTDEEMVMYSQFSQQSNMQLRLMLSDGNRLKGKSYAHVLKSLLRLRVICAHGREMLNEEDEKELEGLTAGTAIDLGDEPDDEPDASFITEKRAYETYEVMVETDVNVCEGCGEKVGEKKDGGDADVVELRADSEKDEDTDETEESVGTDGDDTIGYLNPCFHLLCKACKENFIAVTQVDLSDDHYHECPYCMQWVRWGIFELTRPGLKNMLDARVKKNKKGNKAKWDETTYSGPHTKVKALLEDLRKSQEETALLGPQEPPIRSVVFSGWTTYLDLIEYALDENDIGHVRLDGTMSVKARSAVLKTFATDDEITVLLVSIKAGGQGLNFTAANKVYMMEPQFNPGVEAQAIDRVHRLGQKRDVQIVHYIMRDSVEEKILKLQRKKEMLAELSMERKMSRTEEAKKRIEELRDLFK